MIGVMPNFWFWQVQKYGIQMPFAKEAFWEKSSLNVLRIKMGQNQY